MFATSLHRYIAICLGKAMSFDLLFPAKSSLSMLKYFETVSFMKSQDITFSLSNLNSFIIFSASSIQGRAPIIKIILFSGMKLNTL